LQRGAVAMLPVVAVQNLSLCVAPAWQRRTEGLSRSLQAKPPALFNA
jgi:hypothetical protein